MMPSHWPSLGWRLVLAACLALVPGSLAQVCTQPPGSTRVDQNYTPNPMGDYWLLNNWVDNNPADQRINTNDYFNFQASLTGPPLDVADPTLMPYTSSYGTWYYVTGTTSQYSTANFPIYRTQDFRTFDLHMLAFDESNQNGSNQWRSGSTRHINGTWYTHCWMSQLYYDPTSAPGPNRHLFLVFVGVQEGTDPHNDKSLFVTRIKEADFLSWHSRPWTADGPRFADVRSGLGFQQWYYYNSTNLSGPPWAYAGGVDLTPSQHVPISGNPWWLSGPNCWDPINQPPYILQHRQRGWAHRCWGASTFMVGDAWVYIDPVLPAMDPWKRASMYVWDDANPDVPFSMWGNHIAAHPLLPNNIQHDKNYSCIPMAMDRNTNNRVNGLDNGTVDGSGGSWPLGGVAEAPTAFWHPVSNRHYLLYSRNTWDSSAYQIVYRMTAKGATFSTLGMASFNEPNIQEHVLLRSDAFNVAGRANFGSCEVFTITNPFIDSLDASQYIMAFHCAFDYDTTPGVFTGRRTVFFKELTVDPATGLLVQLGQSATDPRADIRKFRIPLCR